MGPETPDGSLLQPRAVTGITAVDDGWYFMFAGCGHEVWSAIDPTGQPPHVCSECLMLYIGQVRRIRKEEPTFRSGLKP